MGGGGVWSEFFWGGVGSEFLGQNLSESCHVRIILLPMQAGIGALLPFPILPRRKRVAVL